MCEKIARQSNLNRLKSLLYLTSGGTVAYHLIYMKKDFNNYYERHLQSWSQYLNPEFAHRLGVTATKYGIFPSESYTDPDILKTKFLSYTLSNPVGIAAGFDKDGEAVLGLRNLGFAVVEIGSVTPEPQPGNNRPRVFRLPNDNAIINRYGFNSSGHKKVYDNLHTLDKSFLGNGILGVNLGKNKTSDHPVEDYVLGIQKFADVADYFVINVSSPNTPGLRSLQNKEHLRNLLCQVNNAIKELPTQRKPPLLLKLAPDLTTEEKNDIVNVITAPDSRVDGLIISNTTVSRPELKHNDVSTESGGLSGTPLKDMSTEMIREMYRMTKGKIPIVGVGGVFSGTDAFEKILAGASIVQIYTSFIYHGPPIVTKIKSELCDLVKSHGYKSVSDAIGKGAN